MSSNNRCFFLICELSCTLDDIFVLTVWPVAMMFALKQKADSPLIVTVSWEKGNYVGNQLSCLVLRRERERERERERKKERKRERESQKWWIKSGKCFCVPYTYITDSRDRFTPIHCFWLTYGDILCLVQLIRPY